MSHKKIIAIGGCSIHQQKAENTQPSAIEQTENQPDSPWKSMKDTAKDQSKDSAESTDSTQAGTETSASEDSSKSDDSTASTGTSNSADTDSANTGSSKPSGSTGNSSSSASDANPQTSQPVPSKPAKTQPVHQHSYTSSVTTQPTCGEPGVRTYTYSCGKDSYTESIPAAGNHHWVDRYEEQTHTTTVWKDVCNGCGAQFDNPDDALLHVMSLPAGSACRNYSSKPFTTTTTDTVFVGKQCDTCGTWQ